MTVKSHKKNSEKKSPETKKTPVYCEICGIERRVWPVNYEQDGVFVCRRCASQNIEEE